MALKQKIFLEGLTASGLLESYYAYKNNTKQLLIVNDTHL